MSGFVVTQSLSLQKGDSQQETTGKKALGGRKRDQPENSTRKREAREKRNRATKKKRDSGPPSLEGERLFLFL